MASWREINEIGRDPARVHRLAEQLLAAHRNDLTEWELDFLESISQRGSSDLELTTRQAEKLVELRDSMKRYTNVEGLNVKLMIDDCWMGRIDLDEGDEDFLNRVRGRTSLRRGEVSRLLRCARRLHLIDDYIDLNTGVP